MWQCIGYWRSSCSRCALPNLQLTCSGVAARSPCVVREEGKTAKTILHMIRSPALQASRRFTGRAVAAPAFGGGRALPESSHAASRPAAGPGQWVVRIYPPSRVEQPVRGKRVVELALHAIVVTCRWSIEAHVLRLAQVLIVHRALQRVRLGLADDAQAAGRESVDVKECLDRRT